MLLTQNSTTLSGISKSTKLSEIFTAIFLLERIVCIKYLFSIRGGFTRSIFLSRLLEFLNNFDAYVVPTKYTIQPLRIAIIISTILGSLEISLHFAMETALGMHKIIIPNCSNVGINTDLKQLLYRRSIIWRQVYKDTMLCSFLRLFTTPVFRQL